MEKSMEHLEAENKELRRRLADLERSEAEHQRTRNALRESEKRYRSLFETAKGAIIFLAPDHRILEFNPEAERVFGIKGDEVLGKDYLELFVPEEEREGVAADIKKVVQGEPTLGYENRAVAHDGTERILSWNVDRLLDSEGVPTGIIATGQDITNRRRAEEELLREKHFSDAIINSLPGLFYLFDDKGAFFRWNENLEKVTGYTGEEIASMSPVDFFEGEDKKLIAERIEEALSKGESSAQASIVTKSGRGIPHYFTGRLVKIGGRAYISGMGIDIRERRRLEQERDYLFNLSIDMLCVAGFDGYFRQLNPSWMKNLGWAEEELLGKPWIDFVHPEDREATIAAGQQLMEGKSVLSFENRYQCKDGSWRWIAWNSFPLTQEDLIFSVARDITEHKRAEEALRESEERYRTLVDNIELGIALINADYEVVAANVHHGIFAGKDQADLLGRKCFREFEKRDAVCPHCPGREAMATGRPAMAETEGVRDDGSRFPVLLRAFPVYGPQGEPAGFIEVAEDITERKRAEEALRASEEKYRSIFENAQVGIFRTRISDGKMLECNDRLAQMFAYESRGECLEKFVASKHYLDSGTRERMLEIIQSDGEANNFEARMSCAGGSAVWVRYSAKLYPERGYLEGVVADITEEKRAAEAIKRSESILSSALDALDGLLVVTDRDHRIIHSNWKDHEFVTEDQRKGNPYCYKVFKQLDERCEVCPPLQTFNDGKKRIFEEINPVDGRHKEITASPVFDNLGEVVMVVEHVRDITDRKLAEEALLESEEKYRSLVESTPDWVWTCDPEGRQTFANSAVKNLLGYDVDEIVGTSAFSLVHPEDRELNRKKFKRALNRKRGWRKYVVRWKHKDGSTRYFETTAQPILDADGTLAGYSGIDRDITDRKLAEEALKDSERRFRALYQESSKREQLYESLLSSTPDAVAIYNLKGEAAYVNPAFTQIFGFTKKDVEGRRIPFVPEEELLRTLAGIERVIEGEPVAGFETKRLTKDGGLLDVTLSSSLYRDHIGNLAGIVVFLRDVTEQKRLEVQLRQAQKMEAIGTLAGGIAHDFNNILGAIIGNTELALDDAREGSLLRDNMTQVLRAGYRAADLVRQILAFSRTSDQETRPVNISFILKEILKMMRASLPATIEIRQDITASLDSVLADPTQIHQLIMNLCTNAAHAMREGGGLLMLRLSNVDLGEEDLVHHPDLSPGSYLKLTVEDTGHGIEPEFIGRIFDPYFTTKEKGEGTGLGLAMVHGIVKSHGGAIEVESEPGLGTNFHVFLPAVEDVGELEHDESAPPLTGKGRIIFIDDEEVLVRMAKKMLGRLGYEVLATSSGEEALEAFRADPEGYDLVITDQTMPKMTGAELSQRFLEIRPDLPIILCTGYSEVMNEEKAKSLGIREFVMKPLVTRDIARTIKKLL